MKKSEKKKKPLSYVRKTICIDKDLYKILVDLANKDNRGFSPWVELRLQRFAEESQG
jgi:hypothetical protein